MHHVSATIDDQSDLTARFIGQAADGFGRFPGDGLVGRYAATVQPFQFTQMTGL
jgi:hypothetical protein